MYANTLNVKAQNLFVRQFQYNILELWISNEETDEVLNFLCKDKIILGGNL